MSSTPGDYTLRWYNPCTRLYEATTRNIAAGTSIELGHAPGETNADWIALLERIKPKEFCAKNGVVSIEAEHAAAVNGWKKVPGISGMAMRDEGERQKGFITFPITFDEPGRYYIYMLMRRANKGHWEPVRCRLSSFSCPF
ncbi:hypothetical protein JXA70_05225 [candidate division KSB1 bacterium]|nr:hypothetical protein [candidate division KSB1 bacterium]